MTRSVRVERTRILMGDDDGAELVELLDFDGGDWLAARGAEDFFFEFRHARFELVMLHAAELCFNRLTCV